MTQKMIVLGLESSCDETAAAIVDMSAPPSSRILSNVVHSQIELHASFGGVVPEIAAREHLSWINLVIPEALKQAEVGFDGLDLVASTAGPGLIGGLIIASVAGRAIAQACGCAYQDTNHLAGHALTARLTDDLPFPYLLLLVSGGHSQLIVVEGPTQYKILGSTIDDAVGEAFDKVSNLLNLPLPGGPALEKLAKSGDPHRFDLPIPLKNKPGFDFSFSGLKTAARRALELIEEPTEQDKADLAASFQAAAAQSLSHKTKGAMKFCTELYGRSLPLAVAGGVAANELIRKDLQALAESYDVPLTAAPLDLCGDNAAMIAWAGGEQWQGKSSIDWSFAPKPRWPLSELSQE